MFLVNCCCNFAYLLDIMKRHGKTVASYLRNNKTRAEQIKKLIVEIDGSIHEKQQEYDELRTAILNMNRYTVIRFENDELSENSSPLFCSEKRGPGGF